VLLELGFRGFKWGNCDSENNSNGSVNFINMLEIENIVTTVLISKVFLVSNNTFLKKTSKCESQVDRIDRAPHRHHRVSQCCR
jgi:hypothetical protein